MIPSVTNSKVVSCRFFSTIRAGASRTDHLALACDVVGLIEATELSLERDGERVPFEGAYGSVARRFASERS